MFKMTITTQDDLNESLKLHRREVYEDERKKRIFNAKQRLLGLDLPVLERQIIDKAKQRSIDAECNRRYEEQVKIQQHLVHAKSLEMEKRKRLNESDLNFYRCRFQRNEQRREYDLNDPDLLKNGQPARIADDDPTLGISSAQVFSGEDLGSEERRLRQRDQQRSWLDQQILERRQADESRMQAERRLEQSLFSREKLQEEMAESERQMNDQLAQELRQYNAELARIKVDKEMTERQNRAADDLAEIYNMLSSDMLSGNPDVAQSRLNPKKKIAFMYRGMTPEEMKNFREAQTRQRRDKEKSKTERQLIDKQWEQYALNMDKDLMFKQLDLERKEKTAIMDRVAYNAQLAIQQRAQRDYANNVLYINEVSPEFFEQFNKSSR